MNTHYSTEDCCSICYEPYGDTKGHDAYRLKCQHAFGRSCINTWATKSTTCPVCGLETFPEKLSGGLNKFRRLLDRTIFMADPPELRINLGALNGAAVGAAAGAAVGAAAAAAAVGGGAGAAVGAAAGAGAGAAGASFVPISLICAGLGAFRAMTVGREGVFTCSYCLAGSAVFAMISFIL